MEQFYNLEAFTELMKQYGYGIFVNGFYSYHNSFKKLLADGAIKHINTEFTDPYYNKYPESYSRTITTESTYDECISYCVFYNKETNRVEINLSIDDRDFNRVEVTYTCVVEKYHNIFDSHVNMILNDFISNEVRKMEEERIRKLTEQATAVVFDNIKNSMK